MKGRREFSTLVLIFTVVSHHVSTLFVWIRTSLKEIHILKWSAFRFLRRPHVNVVTIVQVKQIIQAPKIIIKHRAALLSSLSLAQLPPPTAPPPHRWRRRGLWTEADLSHHGSVYRGWDAMPVLADEARSCVATAD